MQPVIPVLGQVIGDAKNKNAPEKRDPSKKVVLAWKQNGKHLQAEPGKEWSEDEFGNSEARKVKRLFIPVPCMAVKSKRKLDYSKNDDEEHEPIAMSEIWRGMVHAQPASGSRAGIFPRPAAANVQRKKHQENGQRIDEQAESCVSYHPSSNSWIHLHS
jgi:hypothetical protein